MIKLFGFLKPYLLPLFASIILLFIQATADLTLPDYLSRIVNVGIQQSGISDPVPSVLQSSTFDHVMFFLTPGEQTRIKNAFTLVESSDEGYPSLQHQYANLKNQSVYILGPVSKVERAEISPIIGKGLIAVSFLKQTQEDPEKAAALGESLGIDLSKIPSGIHILENLDKIPAGVKDKITVGIQEHFTTLGEKMVTQMGIAAVKAEYEAMGADAFALQGSYIRKTGSFMILITLVSVIATILVGLLSARVAAGVARDVRQAVFVRVTNFSSAEIEKFSTASLITRSTNDVTQIQMVTMMMMRMVFFAPILGIGGMIRALDKAASMWWIIALMVVALLGLVVGVFSITMPRFKLIQTLIDNLNRVVRENLSGMMVVRAFNRQDFEEDRFDQANLALTKNTLFVSRVMVFMMPVMMFLMSAVSLLVVWVGAHQVGQGQMQVGDMMAFMQYTMQIFFAFMFVSMMFIILPRASVSADRIAAVLETEPAIIDPQEPLHFPVPVRAEIEFHNVCFHYPDAEEDVIHDISFTAHAGETTAFIGTTGSGKSTIVNLVPRFYDVTGGEIMIDGINIQNVSQGELHNQIGYVPQRSNLFTGTIDSNLRFGDENASLEEINSAAEIAQAAEFIAANPDGFGYEISQGGGNVSGGQRQRLAIARALVKRPPIYIFDDSFSALDFKTDAALRSALKKNVISSTIFIVTQRVATIKNADQIIVLDEGSIVGKGTHHELMENCDVYRDIALSQLSREELE